MNIFDSQFLPNIKWIIVVLQIFFAFADILERFLSII